MIVFNLVFSNNSILSYFLLFFLIIEIQILIPAVIVQVFNTTAEFAIPTGTSTYDANAEIETAPMKAETKKENAQTLHKRCPNTEYFLVRIFPYSD